MFQALSAQGMPVMSLMMPLEFPSNCPNAGTPASAFTDTALNRSAVFRSVSDREPIISFSSLSVSIQDAAWKLTVFQHRGQIINLLIYAGQMGKG